MGCANWLIAFLNHTPPMENTGISRPPFLKFNKKKEFPRDGLNFKENLWEFHGVG
jgi:hypothetical protein